VNSSQWRIINTTNEISYNQPKLDPLTVWNPNGITFTNSSIIGSTAFCLFIDRNNTIYIPGRDVNAIQIWINESITPTVTINTNSFSHSSFFVTSNGDMYTGNTITNSFFQIRRWSMSSNESDVIATLNSHSYGIFVDLNNTIYFSIRDQHEIVARSLMNTSNILTIVAGTGCAGNTSDKLMRPYGIFVDTNFDLYVADAGNNRIQLFSSESINGLTVAGNESTNVTIALNYPTSVILDADKYLFIVDTNNNRIIGQGSNGFRCVIGCSGSSGLISNTLNRPSSMAFDSYGNLYVADEYNNRTQKFIRLNTTNIVSYNQPIFCVNATWNVSGITFADNNTIGKSIRGLFITKDNHIYAVKYNNSQIKIWFDQSSVSPSLTLYENLFESQSMFVTVNGEIYVDNGPQVAKLTLNSNESIPVLNTFKRCMGLFIDISNSLYCSDDQGHRVSKKWLGDNSSVIIIVAGNGSNGSTSNRLSFPNGIFVDTNFDLYVADTSNHRIQLFPLGQSNGITINTTTITLKRPMNVILDGNKYLYIADYDNNRIIGQGPFGFRCIVGCYNSSSFAETLNKPRGLAFDSFGNFYVGDQENNRIQKYELLTGLCDQSTTEQPTSLSSTIDTLSLTCHLLIPCLNHGTCFSSSTSIYGYNCSCLTGFNGLQCQYDHRICASTTCWNNGQLTQCNQTNFQCLCQSGWTGQYCQTKIDYCQNILCENNAVCRSTFQNWTCLCLDNNYYSGQYCQIDSSKVNFLKIASRSVAYIVIIFLISTAMFIFTMDILKYVFGIDLAKVKHQPEKRQIKRKHRPIVQRFTYIT